MDMFWRFAQSMRAPTILRFRHHFEREADGRIMFSEVIACGRYMLVPHKLVNGTVMYRRLDGHFTTGPRGGFVAFKSNFERSKENRTSFDLRHDIHQNVTSTARVHLCNGLEGTRTPADIQVDMKKGYWCVCHEDRVTRNLMPWNWSQKGTPDDIPLGKWSILLNKRPEVERDYTNTHLTPVSYSAQWLAKMKAPLAYPNFPGVDLGQLSRPDPPPALPNVGGTVAPPRAIRQQSEPIDG